MIQFLKYKKGALFLALLITFCCTACKKQDLPVKPEPSAFTVSVQNNTVNFPASGGSTTIMVKGGTNGWWLTVPSNTWCQITKTYGSGDFNIPVTIMPNTTGVAREITVTIKPTFNLPPVAIKLTQSN